jgi:hypothetical protein
MLPCRWCLSVRVNGRLLLTALCFGFDDANGGVLYEGLLKGFAHRFRPTYPGFPVEVGGVEQLRMRLSFERKPHTWSWLVPRSRKTRQRWCERRAPLRSFLTLKRLEGKTCGIPHLAKNERDAPNFLYAALDRTACAPLFKERRMKFREPTKLHRKSGMWGTRRLLRGMELKARSLQGSGGSD